MKTDIFFNSNINKDIYKKAKVLNNNSNRDNVKSIFNMDKDNNSNKLNTSIRSIKKKIQVNQSINFFKKDEINIQNKNISKTYTSRNKYNPKDNLNSIIKLNSKILNTESNRKITPFKDNKNFKPKYNIDDINSIKIKNDQQTFNCLGNDQNIPKIESDECKRKYNNLRNMYNINSCINKNDLSENIKTFEIKKQNSLKYKIIDKSNELNKDILKQRKLLENSTTKNCNNSSFSKIKALTELSSNLFNTKKLECINNSHLKNVKNYLSKSVRKTKKQIEEEILFNNISLKPKKLKTSMQNIDNKNRAKSANERKLDNNKSNIFFNNIKEAKDNKNEKSIKDVNSLNKIKKRKKTPYKEETINTNLSKINNKHSTVNKILNNSNSKTKLKSKSIKNKNIEDIGLNNKYQSKDFVLNTLIKYDEKDIKKALSNKGYHLINVKFNNNIIKDNSKSKNEEIEISIRTIDSKPIKNTTIAALFKGCTVKDKQLLNKKKSDIIGTPIDKYDIKMNQRYKNKNLEKSQSSTLFINNKIKPSE